MSSRYNAMEKEFEEVTLLGKPALFTSMRIDRDSVPEGYHQYEIRHDDECGGNAVEAAKEILVNHLGTVIMCGKLHLPPDGHLYLDPEDLYYSTGDCRLMKEFMEKYPPAAEPSSVLGQIGKNRESVGGNKSGHLFRRDAAGPEL